MYQRIMATLDGSCLAEVALPCAQEISVRLGSDLILVGVYEAAVPRFQHMYQGYLNGLAEASEHRIREHYGVADVKVNAVLLTGHPAEQIIHYAEQNDIGLIVMATHGYSGVKRWALGSIADKVARGASKPVLLIRAKDCHPEVREQDICKKVIIPLDGSRLAEAALTCAESLMGALASHYSVEANLLHVMTPLPHQATAGSGESFYDISDENLHRFMMVIKDNTERARDYLCQASKSLLRQGVVVNCEVRTGDAANEIIKCAGEINAGVVVMATHGLSGLDRWVLGSVANRVLRKGKSAVMLVRPPAAVSK